MDIFFRNAKGGYFAANLLKARGLDWLENDPAVFHLDIETVRLRKQVRYLLG